MEKKICAKGQVESGSERFFTTIVPKTIMASAEINNSHGSKTVNLSTPSISPPTAIGRGSGRYGAVVIGLVIGVVVKVVIGVVVKVVIGVVVKVVTTLQVGPFTLLVSNVTAPVCARAPPFKVAPVFRVMLAYARIFPVNTVFVPRVAELPTCHHTSHGSPPTTLELGEVVSVLPALKIQTPDPVRVSVPDNEKELLAQ